MKRLFRLFAITFSLTVLVSASVFADGFNSIHTADGNYVIAAGNDGRIFRSVNGGNTWAAYTEPSVTFKSVFVFGNSVWLSTSNGKIYKSSTSTTALTPYSTGVSTSINSICFVNELTGFVCGDNSLIYKTVDGGITWTPSFTGISGTDLNAISFKDAQNGIAGGTNGKVYVTVNGGTSWTAETINTTRSILDVKMFNDGVVAAGEWGVLFTKPNAGAWSQAKTNIRSDIRGIAGSSMTDVHVCGGGGFIRNNKNGNSLFRNFEINPMLANLVDIVYSGNKGFAVSSLNNAIIRTTNSGTLWELPSGTTVSYSWAVKPGASGNFLGNNLCLHPTDRNSIFIAFANQVYKSNNKGEEWAPVGNAIPSGSTPHSFFVSPVDTNIWLVATESSPTDKIYRTTNYGQSWTEVLARSFSNYGQPLEMDQNNPTTFYFAPDNGGFYRSVDNGATFTEISNNFAFRSPCDIIVMHDSSKVLFVADGITGSGLAKVFKSVNGGVNWTDVYTATSSEIPSMANTVFDQSLVWTTEWSGSNINRSTNYGDNFSVHHSNGFSGWGSDICHEDPTMLITGSWGASATLSFNGGSNWTNISSGLSGHGGGIMIPDRGYILCHQGSNVYKLNVIYSVVTGVSENNISAIPSDFMLSQNYPNPFNPSTKISFSIPNSSNVALKVYNELGAEVASLIDGYRKAGSYEVNFDASGLSSGIYFYKIQTGSFSETKKMMLIK
jgi:photosystem II stability/assembly factor-like uncharacterized protein